MKKFLFWILSLLVILSSSPTASLAEEAVGTKTPKVSVIIPVYKVEPWLRECMDSIVNQTLKEIEIICVDDGSPDNCGKILDEYASKDNRITVIHQKNQGVSVARNSGLELAHGEYITFVDSDDYIELDTYEKTYQLAKKDDVDILQFGIVFFKDGKDVPSPHQIQVLDEPLIPLETAFQKFRPSACLKLFKAEIIQKNKVRFIADVSYSEDNLFSFMATAHAKKIKVIPAKLYHYRQHPNSAIHTVSEECRAANFRKVSSIICDYWRNSGRLAGNEHLVLQKAIGWVGHRKKIDSQTAKKILDSLGHDIYNTNVIKKCSIYTQHTIKKLEAAAKI